MVDSIQGPLLKFDSGISRVVWDQIRDRLPYAFEDHRICRFARRTILDFENSPELRAKRRGS